MVGGDGTSAARASAGRRAGAAPPTTSGPEPGQAQLGLEVVLVEDEPHTARPPEAGGQPVGFRRVARLDHLERPAAPDLARRPGSPGPFGQTTPTSNPCAVSALHSSQERRSSGTGRFWTMTSTWVLPAMQPISDPLATRTGSPAGIDRFGDSGSSPGSGEAPWPVGIASIRPRADACAPRLAS